MKSWKNGAKKLLIIQNWTFFSSTAWLPKRPILGRNRNLKGSPCLLSIYSLLAILTSDNDLPVWLVASEFLHESRKQDTLFKFHVTFMNNIEFQHYY